MKKLTPRQRLLALTTTFALCLPQLALAGAAVMGNGHGIASIAGGPAASAPQAGSPKLLIDGHTDIATKYYGFQFSGPLSFVLDFDQAYDLSSFVLWNDRDLQSLGGENNNGDGVATFSLDFFDAANHLLGRYTGSSPDSVSQVFFDFGQTLVGVKSVNWTIDSMYGPPGAHNKWEQIREVGFNYTAPASGSEESRFPILAGSGFCDCLIPLPPSGFPDEPPLPPVPEAETYALMLAGLGLVAWAARRRTRA